MTAEQFGRNFARIPDKAREFVASGTVPNMTAALRPLANVLREDAIKVRVEDDEEGIRGTDLGHKVLGETVAHEDDEFRSAFAAAFGIEMPPAECDEAGWAEAVHNAVAPVEMF